MKKYLISAVVVFVILVLAAVLFPKFVGKKLPTQPAPLDESNIQFVESLNQDPDKISAVVITDNGFDQSNRSMRFAGDESKDKFFLMNNTNSEKVVNLTAPVGTIYPKGMTLAPNAELAIPIQKSGTYTFTLSQADTSSFTLKVTE